MDLEELQTFVAIADAGGISPAALRLGVSKSIVSRRLSRLEADLGVRLLSRSTRGAALTDAGVTFREHALKACTQISLAIAIACPGRSLQGRLRIVAPLSCGTAWVAPVFVEMALRHPRLHLQICYSDRLEARLAEGYDCAIGFGWSWDAGLAAQCVGSLRRSAVASPDYVRIHGAPETPEALLRHQALLLDTDTWSFLDNGNVIVATPPGRFRTNNGTALAAAAVAGLGIACLPDILIREQLASGVLLPVMTRCPPAPVAAYLFRPRGQLPAQNIDALGGLLAEYLEQLALPAGAPFT